MNTPRPHPIAGPCSLTPAMRGLALALVAVVVAIAPSLGQRAQEVELAEGTVLLGDQELDILITEEGDTLLLPNLLDDVSVSSPRSFDNPEDAKLYRKYRYYAPKVYPYAVEAIRIFRETEYVTATMPKRKAKRHIRRLQKELKKEFEDPLRKLTKTQGYLLVKMIERETERPMHYLIKDLRGGLTATYWTTMGKMFGHELKAGYHVGVNPILDVVLQDYDISHEVVERAAEASAEALLDD